MSRQPRPHTDEASCCGKPADAIEALIDTIAEAILESQHRAHSRAVRDGIRIAKERRLAKANATGSPAARSDEVR